MLKAEISRLEKELIEKDLKIARLTGYLDGAKDGFELARKIVIQKIKSLPPVEANEDSMINFFNSLTAFVKEVEAMEYEKLKS